MDQLESRSNRGSRRAAYGAIAVVLLVVAVIAWRSLANRTPGLDAPPDKVQQFVASDQFKNLPKPEKAQWVEAAEKSLTDGGVQEKMFHNLAQAKMQTNLDAYFGLPEGKARQDYLDKQIDEQEKIRKMIDDGPSTQPGRIVIRKGGATASAQKDMAEGIPAEYQAKMAQYVKDIKARRAARGLPTEGVPMGFMYRITK